MDPDAVVLIKGQRLLERGQDAGSFFIGKEGGKGDSGMVIDGDVEGFDARAWIAVGTVAGGTDPGLKKTAKLFNIKMKELAGSGAFVTEDWRLGRVKRSQAVETMPLEDAGKGSFRDGKDHKDLSIGAALFAEREDLGFEFWSGFARLAAGRGRVIREASREALSIGASEPAADGFFADAKGGSRGSERAAELDMSLDHLDSRQGRKFGISVHSVRAE